MQQASRISTGTRDDQEPDVRVGRVYDQPSPDDSSRILVDRLWPRGLSKDAAQVDEWLKVAPSTKLRRWYGHEPTTFPEFRRRYTDELREPERVEALNHLTKAAREGTVTLLTASGDSGAALRPCSQKSCWLA
jgi:uncharacterized protein YeaO (DUF488 family)